MKPGKARQLSAGDLGIRFGFGAGVSFVAGVVATVWGPHLGGVFLAFPAILLASLTIVAKKEGAAKARDEARGAALGTLGLVAFGVVGAITLARWPPAGSLAAATAAWAAVSVTAFGVLYVLGAGADEQGEGGEAGSEHHHGVDDGDERRGERPDRRLTAPVPVAAGHRARLLRAVPVVVAIAAMLFVAKLRRSRRRPASRG